MRALESMSGYMNDLFAVGGHPEMLQPELQSMSYAIYALIIGVYHLPHGFPVPCCLLLVVSEVPRKPYMHVYDELLDRGALIPGGEVIQENALAKSQTSCVIRSIG